MLASWIDTVKRYAEEGGMSLEDRLVAIKTEEERLYKKTKEQEETIKEMHMTIYELGEQIRWDGIYMRNSQKEVDGLRAKIVELQAKLATSYTHHAYQHHSGAFPHQHNLKANNK